MAETDFLPSQAVPFVIPDGDPACLRKQGSSPALPVMLGTSSIDSGLGQNDAVVRGDL